MVDVKKELVGRNEKPLHASEVQRKKSKAYLLIDGSIEDTQKSPTERGKKRVTEGQIVNDFTQKRCQIQSNPWKKIKRNSCCQELEGEGNKEFLVYMYKISVMQDEFQRSMVQHRAYR